MTVTMLLSTLLAVAPIPVGFSASIERVPVRTLSAKASVDVDSLSSRVTLTDVVMTAQTKLCPTRESVDGHLVLKCSSRKLWASLEKDARGSYLDLRELTTSSWFDEASRVPATAWSLQLLGLPDTCPGRLAAARGECALARGDWDTAKAAWEEALTGPDVGLAHVRLGDVALRSGDVEGAMNHYAKVIPSGPIGRLAQARACELIGNCFTVEESARVANSEGLAREFGRELRLYTLHRELVAGRDLVAISMLVESLQKDDEMCVGTTAFCQKIIEAGLASDDVEARMGALSAFLTDRLRRGPRETTMSLAAARTAREIGAPAFAAAILANHTPLVPREKLAGHLLEIVQLYASAQDRVRAGVVLEYAEAKVGAQTRSADWNRVRKQLGRRATNSRSTPSLQSDDGELERLAAQVSLTTDLARAAQTLVRAVEDPSQGSTP